jgi:RNA polymerase sigma-70 factor (ECF subfamily)
MDAEPARLDSTLQEAEGDEASLLQLAKSGDARAFGQLVELHEARVFGVALRLMGQHVDAEDMAQDVFVQLHRWLARIENPAHLRHWLLRTVTHRSIDRLRQQAKRGQHLPLEALGEGPEAHAEEPAHDPMAAAQLHRLLLELQPDARAVMILRYQEDLDPTDIAALLGMPGSTVKSHLHRSLQWLRRKYAGGTHGS